MARVLRFSVVLLIAGSAVATPPDHAAALEQEQAFQAILDAAMTEMMRPGPKRQDWNQGGVALHSSVEAAPNGSEQNFILSVDKDGDRTLIIPGATDATGYVPAGWQPVLRAGSGIGGGEATDVTFGHLDGQSYFAGAQARKRVGDAYCSTGGMVGVLYRDSKRRIASALPKGSVEALFAMMIKRFEKQTICWRYDPDGDGYRVSHFLEDGQSLPALDEAGYRARLVPAAPVDQLLGPPKKD